MSGTRQPLSVASLQMDAGSPQLEAVELMMLDLHLKRPVVTSYGVEDARPVVTARVITSASDGYGECAALAAQLYSEESAAGAFAVLENELIPQLVAWSSDHDGRLPSVRDTTEISSRVPGNPMAKACMEMAVIDAWLRAAGVSFGRWLGARNGEADAGAVVGIAASMDELLGRVSDLARSGYGRVKIKISPLWDVEPVRVLRDAFPRLSLCVDANGSYDQESMHRLERLDDMGLAFIEQPFKRDDLQLSARLTGILGTPICLDESLGSLGCLYRATRLRALDVACIKSARMGGIGEALEALPYCARRGIGAYIGGMYDTGLGRRANTALACLGLTDFPADLGGGELFVEGDPFGALEVKAGKVQLYDGAGIAPVPPAGSLGAHCSKSRLFRL
ncbi:MAG: o-succinylbenzoate synthase [Acidimicrobiales bacterium]